MAKPLIDRVRTVGHDDARSVSSRHGRPNQHYGVRDSARWPKVASASTPAPSTMTVQPKTASPFAPPSFATFTLPRGVDTTFHAAPLSLDTPVDAEVTVLIGGDVHYFPVTSGQTLLEAASEAGLHLPRSSAVACSGACKCTLAGGSVERPDDACLKDDERDARQISTCMARPTSAWVILEFD